VCVQQVSRVGVAAAPSPVQAHVARTCPTPSPSPTLPLDLESVRAHLARQLHLAQEENRSLYIDSSRRMIHMQAAIDALTRENVQLIREITPNHMQHW
jgi:hypothetical protein